MRPSTIAASLALAAATMVAFAQDVPAGGVPATTEAPVSAASAEPAPPAATPAATSGGDIARGRELTYTCQGCHGVVGYKNAYPNYHVPKLGGQSEQYLHNALTAYQQGSRKHPTMQAQAESFSEQDIADIAAFLSTLK